MIVSEPTNRHIKRKKKHWTNAENNFSIENWKRFVLTCPKTYLLLEQLNLTSKWISDNEFLPVHQISIIFVFSFVFATRSTKLNEMICENRTVAFDLCEIAQKMNITTQSELKGLTSELALGNDFDFQSFRTTCNLIYVVQLLLYFLTQTHNKIISIPKTNCMPRTISQQRQLINICEDIIMAALSFGLVCNRSSRPGDSSSTIFQFKYHWKCRLEWITPGFRNYGVLRVALEAGDPALTAQRGSIPNCVHLKMECLLELL